MFIHLDGTDMHCTILDADGNPTPIVVERIESLDRMIGDMPAAIQTRPGIKSEDWLSIEMYVQKVHIMSTFLPHLRDAP